MNARVRAPRIITVGPDHPLHPMQQTARKLEQSWLRRVRSAGTWELLQMRGEHQRLTGEHNEDDCWKCVALARAHTKRPDAGARKDRRNG
jgi:hypothetical protein